MTHKGILTAEENARMYAVIIICVVLFLVLLIAFIVAIILYGRYCQQKQHKSVEASHTKQEQGGIVYTTTCTLKHSSCQTEPIRIPTTHSSSQTKNENQGSVEDAIKDRSVELRSPAADEGTTTSDTKVSITPTPTSTRNATPQKVVFEKKPDPIFVTPAPAGDEEVVPIPPPSTEFVYKPPFPDSTASITPVEEYSSVDGETQDTEKSEAPSPNLLPPINQPVKAHNNQPDEETHAELQFEPVTKAEVSSFSKSQNTHQYKKEDKVPELPGPKHYALPYYYRQPSSSQIFNEGIEWPKPAAKKNDVLPRYLQPRKSQQSFNTRDESVTKGDSSAAVRTSQQPKNDMLPRYLQPRKK